jgi:hypothetical protein
MFYLIRYSEFRLSVNMCASSLGNSCVRVCNVWCIVDISAWSMFCSPISFWGMFIFSSGFQMPESVGLLFGRDK